MQNAINPITSNIPQTVSPFPAPPEYAKGYTNERIELGSAAAPPPVQSEFTVFGELYKLDDDIIRPLSAQDPPITQLYPSSKVEWKIEMKKLLKSAVAAFLDLLEILIRNPNHKDRLDKFEDIKTIFFNIHHLINEFRPLQARLTLQAMQQSQINELEEMLGQFKTFLDGGKSALRASLNMDGIVRSAIPEKPSWLLKQEAEDVVQHNNFTTEEFLPKVDPNQPDDDADRELPTDAGLAERWDEMGDAALRRLAKELEQLSQEPPNGVQIAKDVSANLREWTVQVDGAPNTLYEGEHFTLQFRFSDQYPFSSPEVIFVGENIPIHPHVYSNGHICLSILTDDWTPALSVSAVCLSILSMLSSCKEKKRPPDNALYVRTCGKNPNKTRWWFHDDTV
ncbi:unnamed protein product, partial [Mesorhabditis spiculigera]